MARIPGKGVFGVYGVAISPSVSAESPEERMDARWSV